MDWKIEFARNGQKTLLLNSKYIYSKYNPQNDIERFLGNEIKPDSSCFLMIGLGLGYHIDYILKKIPQVEIQYILLDEQEESFCSKHILNDKRVRRYNANENFNAQAQIIIPQPFLNALNDTHPLFSFIEDIKIRQMSYERFRDQMFENFNENIKLFKPLDKIQNKKSKAALVSSGPSLNETIHWLKKYEHEFDIYCVGSALKVLLKENIYPKKVFMIDAQDTMIAQITEQYIGELVFLSTANFKAVMKHLGPKQIIFQKGYELAESFAKEKSQPLFETGGSVATTAFSYIEWADYKSLYLFGQDLGFVGNETHSKYSTSGRMTMLAEKLLTVTANDGTEIFTTRNLMAYKRWFDQQCEKTNLHVYNTAKKGAFIKGTTFLDSSNFINLD